MKSSQRDSGPKHNTSAPLPWMKMMLVFVLVFGTGCMYLLQGYGTYFMGSILGGAPRSILSAYDCPEDSGIPVASPVASLEILPSLDRAGLIASSTNKSLTAWYTYNTSHALRLETIDRLSFATDEQSLLDVYADLYAGKGSWHGAVDYSTSLLEDVNPYALAPFQAMRIVIAGYKNGYGNSVAGCYIHTDNNKKKSAYLYYIGHLDSVMVNVGDLVKAGDRIGKVGNTGDVFGALGGYHLHIGISRDGYLKDPGTLSYMYPMYFPQNLEDILAKTVDFNLLLLKGELAYSIVENESLRTALFNQGVKSYVANRNAGTTLASGATPLTAQVAVGNGEQLKVVPVFNRYRLAVDSSKVLAGDSQTVVLEALDAAGAVLTSHQDSQLRLSISPTSASSDAGGAVLVDGKMVAHITGLDVGTYFAEYTNGGAFSSSISWEVVMPDLFQVVAPQETFEGLPVVFRVKALRNTGEEVSLSSATVSVFPQVVEAPQSVSFSDGSVGEFTIPFTAGIYDVKVSRMFGAKEVSGQVRLIVREKQVVEGSQHPVSTEASSAPISSEPVAPSVPEAIVPSTTAASQVSENQSGMEPVVPSLQPIVVSESDDYLLFRDQKGHLIVSFDDRKAREAGEQYPLLLKEIHVPEGTDMVRIDPCYNWTLCSAGVVLSKFDPAKGHFDYAFRYTGEIVYRRVIALQNGEQKAELYFKVVPLTQGLFTDVVKGVTDEEVYLAVEVLKQKGIVTGNPDGSFGVRTSLNRASFVTFLARALKVDLNSIQVQQNSFEDLIKGAWYEKWIYWAAYVAEPQLIKGSGDGKKVLPDKPVWPEELATVVLRLLKKEIPKTEPWYDGAMKSAVEIGLYMSGEEVAGRDIPRSKVAVYLVRALDLFNKQTKDSGVRLSVSTSVVPSVPDEGVSTPVPIDNTVAPSLPIEEAVVADSSPSELQILGKVNPVARPSDVMAYLTLEGVVLTWQYPSREGVLFSVYARKNGQGNFEQIGQVIDLQTVHLQGLSGDSWEYVVDAVKNGSHSDTTEPVKMKVGGK